MGRGDSGWMIDARELDVRQLALRGHDGARSRFLYLRRNEHFYFVRNMFMVAMAIALVGYVAFPTAPPRFMPELGFRDSVGGVHRRRRASPRTRSFNPYAAVPRCTSPSR